MEAYAKLVIVALLVAATMGNEAVGQSTICGMTINGLMSCKPSVSGPKPVPPSPACCSSLAKADLKCLCSYKSSMPSLGIKPNLAMQLPVKCNLRRSVPC